MSPNSGRVANEEPAERRLQQQCSCLELKVNEMCECLVEGEVLHSEQQDVLIQLQHTLEVRP